MEAAGILKTVSRDWQSGKFLLTFEVEGDITWQLEGIREQRLSIAARRFRRKRSLDANAYYWQLLSKLAESAGISKSRAHNLMLRRYGQTEMVDGRMIYVVVPDDESGEEKALEAETYHIKPTSEVKQARDGSVFRTYIMLRGSSTYDTHEMSELINGLVSECQEMGIETMTPDQLAEMMVLYEQHRKKVNSS